MKLLSRWALAVWLALLPAATSGGNVPPAVQEGQPSPAAVRVNQLLGEAGYNFQKHTNTVWTVPFEGQTLKNFTVIVSIAEDDSLVVVFVTLVKKDQMNASVELWHRMLRLNDEFDRVKVGLDDDEDAFVRVDLSPRTLDAVELKANIEQVAAASDEVYAAIQPYLAPAATP